MDAYTIEVAMIVIAVAAWLGGMIAQRMAGPAGGARKASASANAAAGGFLLGAGLFHFLPESHAHFEELYPGHEFPIGFALCATGFTAILAIERLLFDPQAHELEGRGGVGKAPFLATALSSHALLAGVAVGSETTTLGLFSMTVALGVHKFAAAFTLGSSLVRGHVSTGIFRLTILGFALATPLGMLVGGQAQHFLAHDAGLLVEATFDALAAGTFLYIAALDVVHDEFFHKKASWLDLLLFVGGLLVMAALSLVH